MVKQWDIWFLDLNPTIGSEQNGIRPVLVVSNDDVNDYLKVFTMIPFSSIKPGAKVYPTEIFVSAEDSGLKKDSVLMIQQMRTVSQYRIKSHLISKIKNIKVQDQIKQGLIQYFNL